MKMKILNQINIVSTALMKHISGFNFLLQYSKVLSHFYSEPIYLLNNITSPTQRNQVQALVCHTLTQKDGLM